VGVVVGGVLVAVVVVGAAVFERWRAYAARGAAVGDAVVGGRADAVTGADTGAGAGSTRDPDVPGGTGVVRRTTVPLVGTMSTGAVKVGGVMAFGAGKLPGAMVVGGETVRSGAVVGVRTHRVSDTTAYATYARETMAMMARRDQPVLTRRRGRAGAPRGATACAPACSCARRSSGGGSTLVPYPRPPIVTPGCVRNIPEG